MKRSYPIILTQGKEHILVTVPDFNINTQGLNLKEAIKMAYDAIGIVGVDILDSGESLPVPSKCSDVLVPVGGECRTVEVDFAEYRRKNDL